VAVESTARPARPSTSTARTRTGSATAPPRRPGRRAAPDEALQRAGARFQPARPGGGLRRPGAQALANGMQVANLSLGTGRASQFSAFHRLADEAYFEGCTLVCAVNNMPAPSYPSGSRRSCRWPRSVAPTRSSTTTTRRRRRDRAPGIGVGAVDGRSHHPRHRQQLRGAAHHGLIARLLSKHPGLTPFQVNRAARAGDQRPLSPAARSCQQSAVAA
jgi:hypothetical protein